MPYLHRGPAKRAVRVGALLRGVAGGGGGNGPTFAPPPRPGAPRPAPSRPRAGAGHRSLRINIRAYAKSGRRWTAVHESPPTPPLPATPRPMPHLQQWNTLGRPQTKYERQGVAERSAAHPPAGREAGAGSAAPPHIRVGRGCLPRRAAGSVSSWSCQSIARGGWTDWAHRLHFLPAF